jgi:hypothetical protein
VTRPGLELGRKLCEMAGIAPDGVQSITLTLNPRSVPMATFERVMLDDGELVSVLARYTLTEIPEPDSPRGR